MEGGNQEVDLQEEETEEEELQEEEVTVKGGDHGGADFNITADAC